MSSLSKIKLALIGLFLSVNEARASQHDNLPGVNLTLDGLVNIIRDLACWLANIAIILIVIAVVFYGIQFLTSRGDPTKVTNARKSLGWGIVGILVIFGTYTIIASVANAIGGQSLPFIPLNCG